jgi:hypothetical protein
MKVISNVNLVPFIHIVVTNKTAYMDMYMVYHIHTTTNITNYKNMIDMEDIIVYNLHMNHTIK